MKITPYDALVLLAVTRANPPNGKMVAHNLIALGLAVSSVYRLLRRLEHQGLLRSWSGEKRPVPGGKAPTLYSLNGHGRRALRKWQDALATLDHMKTDPL